MATPSLIGRAVARVAAPVLGSTSRALPKPQGTQFARAFAKSASPETPLMHYTATQQATSSINHRIMYVNVVAMVFVIDAGSALVDL
eukprot:CAMPEP_0170622342 /NCGR_PEP_ID=MMETSP0224-20130122/29078_1 /TAXON_ID=285029 /ORGANISM="Togula jolla, Strain CCCM 725" /LENGTH=86 /DNA_ID=CAMNT_0010948651 /DNA_START=56 /DNA_END=316 /DNA_ORIENTATION=-